MDADQKKVDETAALLDAKFNKPINPETGRRKPGPPKGTNVNAKKNTQINAPAITAQAPYQGQPAVLKDEASFRNDTMLAIKQAEYASVWREALLTVMQTRQVMVAQKVAECVPIADEVLRIYKEKFK